MKRILVVDDDAMVLAAIERMLSEAGYAVTRCGDGASAIQSCRLGRADLVLCDLFMPDTDGMEVIRALRREHPEVKVIAMSGGGHRGVLDVLPLARGLGAVDALYKPLDRVVLLAAVGRALRAEPGGYGTSAVQNAE